MFACTVKFPFPLSAIANLFEFRCEQKQMMPLSCKICPCSLDLFDRIPYCMGEYRGTFLNRLPYKGLPLCKLYPHLWLLGKRENRNGDGLEDVAPWFHPLTFMARTVRRTGFNSW